MPNWCSNFLEVIGDKEELKRFKQLSLTKDEDDYDVLTFAGTCPEPDYETTPVAKTYPEISAKFAETEEEKAKIMENKPTIREDNWWDWRVQNWGTKWDAGGVDISDNANKYLAVSFATAWGPPAEWIENIYKDFPNLEFRLEYEEPGCMFGGEVRANKDGFSNEHFDLENASECCNAKVYHIDDDDYTLPIESVNTVYGTEYQCSKCKEECDTTYMNSNLIKS